ncbi:MAG: hypothetical protein J7L51_02320 [Desulfurococcales archaeon]|nr:hypothetical protein [Desulfurococcales archaeon]
MSEAEFEIAKPKVVDVSAEVTTVTDRVMHIKVGNSVIFIKRSSKSYSMSVWALTNGKVQLVARGEIRNPYDVVNLDLDDPLKDVVIFYLTNWDYFLEQKVAEIMLKGSIKVVPSKVTDKEALAYEIAKRLINEYDAAVLKLKVGDKLSNLGIYCYDGYVWHPCEEEIKSAIKNYLVGVQKYRVTKNVVDEVLKNKLELLNSIELDASDERPLIAFENGVFDWEAFIEGGDLSKALHEPYKDIYVFHKIRHRLNVDIVKEARKGLEKHIPPTSSKDIIEILKALSPRAYSLLRSWAWFEGINESLLTSRIAFLLEATGRSMLPGYRLFGSVVFKDIFMLQGNKIAGKTTFLIGFMGNKILGKENYATTKLRYLGSDNEETVMRTLGKLYNYLAVIAPDVGKRDRVSDWSIIRSISGGDPQTGRRLFRDAFDYFPHYKIYIGSNNPPPINETGVAKEALLERIKVMEFKNRFEQSDFKIDTVLREEDIEVVIVCSLYALRAAYERGAYSFTGIIDVEDAINRYAYPEHRAVMEMVEAGLLKLDPTLRISSSDLYRLVCDYIIKKTKEGSEGSEDEEEEEEEETLKLPDQSTFTKNLKKLLAPYKVKTVKKANVTYFKGIGEPKKGLL